MDIDDTRFKIAAARRILQREGCDSGIAGHVSVRSPGEDAFWVTPFEYFDETTPDRLLRVTFDLEVLEGDWAPSPAIQFHAAIYRERPDVGSIIHTHSYEVSLFSTLGTELGMYNVVAALFHGRQALFCDDGSRPSADGKPLAAALGDDKSVVIMQNHGAVITGPTLEHAAVDAISLEKAARYHNDAVRLGGREMPLAEVEQTQRDYDEHFRPATWAANFRRLRRSDPDLFDHLDGEDR
ncbi:class II aldolase/adducin family protein [Rhabdothermincola salaria]|uniref:class II aldolase/adducin family protein n=1 Tax=Rhabdothermincola salaria TaxID=2903142 RepID=UPI001E3A8517|nr:class II aldolase/adducin family protein [Rhabdothermincola salaria]